MALYRKRERLKKIGWTAEAYDAAHAAQLGLCAICKRPETNMLKRRVKSLAADHDHSTGKPRGLLCRSCNLALGHLEDNPDNVRAALRYLESHKEVAR